jgi:tetratricopeptide (TPR) repeat protein
LGVVAYEMLTGQVPFDGDTPFSVGVKHVNEAPPPPSAISPRAQEPVEAAVLKALAKKPEDRYETARAFAEALATAVAHLQERDLANAYEQAQQLLKARHYEEALALLERLEATQPGYGDVAALTRQAQEGLEIAALYAQADEQLQAVRELASQIVVHDPTYPDTKGVLAVLEPRRVSPKPGNLKSVSLHNALFWAGITLTLCGYFSDLRRQPLYAAINTPREIWQHTRWLWAAHGQFSDWVPTQIWAPILVSLLVMVLYFLRHKFGRWSRLLKLTSAALLLLGNAAIWSVAPVLKLDKSNGFWMISAGMLSLLATMLILLRENGERPIFPQRSRQA